MIRVHVVLHLTRISAQQLALFAAHILLAMTGNVNFTTPFPTLLALQTAINNLNTAITNQVRGNKASTQAVKTAVYQLKRVLRAMCAYVEYTCNDNATIALSSGFSLASTPIHNNAPFTIRHNGALGEMDVRSKATAGASYIWQYTTTPLVLASWVTAATTKQSKHTITGLTPGVMYWFRVSVVTKDGQQPASNAINIFALSYAK